MGAQLGRCTNGMLPSTIALAVDHKDVGEDGLNRKEGWSRGYLCLAYDILSHYP